MIITKRFASVDAALAHIDTLPMNVIRQALAEFLVEGSRADKIIITEEQLNQFFRVRGRRVDAETGDIIAETRGRKRKDSVEG